MVNAGVKLSSVYGATECGDITYFFRNEVEQKLWEWVQFGPNSKIRWVPQDDGTYECQVLVRLDLYICLRFEYILADNCDTSSFS